METQQVQTATPVKPLEPNNKSQKGLVIGLALVFLLIGAMVLFLFKGGTKNSRESARGDNVSTSKSTSVSAPTSQADTEPVVVNDLSSLDKDIQNLDKSLDDKPVNLSQ